jgi:hypothetical protein
MIRDRTKSGRAPRSCSLEGEPLLGIVAWLILGLMVAVRLAGYRKLGGD